MSEADASQLVFLDETSTPLTMTPRLARAPRGARAVGTAPQGRRQAVTLVATVSAEGMRPAMTVPGALDRVSFETFVEHCLVPALQPGQTVLLDNINMHKSATARQQIEAAGCTLCFLPRDSPDFNPIELAFAKLKPRLRRCQARTVDALISATAEALTLIRPDDVRGYFGRAGYPL
jgi:transposase